MLIRTISRQQKDLWMRYGGKNPWMFVFKGEGPNATFVEAVQAFELAGKRYVILTKQSNDSKYQLLILAHSR